MPQDHSTTRPIAPHRDTPRGKTGLLIIDMINRFDFEEGDRLHDRAVRVADRISHLRQSADASGIPVIYANDHSGEWHAEKSLLIESAMQGGNSVSEKILPRNSDYFVIKPQFSAFYATSLPVLLPKLGISRLVLTGIATDICVMFTAADAHMRDYAIWVPQDAVTTFDESGRWALDLMRDSMGAETAPTSDLTFKEWNNRLDASDIR